MVTALGEQSGMWMSEDGKREERMVIVEEKFQQAVAVAVEARGEGQRWRSRSGCYITLCSAFCSKACMHACSLIDRGEAGDQCTLLL
jgi:hypothetical protein